MMKRLQCQLVSISLEDGRLVVVEAEGLIADVREVSDEVPAKEEETEDLEEEVKEEMSYATKEELAEVKTMVEEIKAMLEPKEEMSEEVKEEEVKEELSSVKPIKHNPEASTPQKKQVQFAKGQFNTTLDRVLSKLNK